MDNDNLLKTGIAGTLVMGIYCSTPALVLLLGRSVLVPILLVSA